MPRKKKIVPSGIVPATVVASKPDLTPYKIAILGTATTSVHHAPYNDPTWKIWDMSINFRYGRRYNLFFELHTPAVLATYKNLESYYEFLKKGGSAVVAGHPSPLWPEATMFPLQAIMEEFGSDYFTCSAALMIAFALYLHRKSLRENTAPVGEIGLWGVDMASMEGEYQHQKPCVEYWIGVARGMGIKVTVAEQSPICRTDGIYGFENLKISRELTEKANEMRGAIKELEIKERNEGLTGIIVNPVIQRLIELRFCLNEFTQHMNRFGL